MGLASASNISRCGVPQLLALARIIFFFKKINFSLNLNLNFAKSKTYIYYNFPSLEEKF